MRYQEVVSRLAQHLAWRMITISLPLVSGPVDQQQQLVRQLAGFAESGGITQLHYPATLGLPILLDFVKQRILGKPLQFRSRA